MGVGVIGTFGATGVSGSVEANYIEITMDFGSGSVDVEKQMPSGNWIKIETAITADYAKAFSSPVLSVLRLNCTAWVSAIEYAIKPGTRP